MTAIIVSDTAAPPESTQPDFTARFWGVRGSIASPGPDTLRYGGNTPCVEVRCGDALLILDAGTGIRPLGEALVREALVRQGATDIDLLLTHSHLDHICGLPFFAPAFHAGSRLRISAGHLEPGRTIRSVLQCMMASPLFPVPVEIFRADCSFHDFVAGETLHPKPGVTVRTGRLNHPDGATGYRVEFAGRSLCYVTDTEHPAEGRDAAVVELARGADLLIYDSTYTDAEYPAHAGWGHSTWQEALRVAEAAGVGRAVIFHHDPKRTDDELDAIAAAAEAARPGTIVAREGMVLAP
ncbi:MBL fold metallo-hydrolase [Azospirillum rugosum]|uniref:Phosphoribosyl 1,2-cyclic phosphodiesterase n=1 Tax=Azospirillum rugosum TaxID=416170 RepID=A0ABS4SP79_9PROT|nr:MBL fold metallo-hydrolase [Azospirillum rugosum]MBP2293903.1 phosphoribosyl 1,2-cyclic phosphodiesterase [Azospirillum rugosum]MDQ0526910.1 phosphoribosyl 1,2-cyclic phosphodiesterase [Azospirillum rugosum]